MEEIDFGANFVAGNSNKLQKLGLEGKISRALNVKNKECLSDWANGIGYTSIYDI